MTKKWLYIDNKQHVLLNTDRIRDFYIQKVNKSLFKVQCALVMPNSIITCAEYQDLESAEHYLEKIRNQLES